MGGACSIGAMGRIISEDSEEKLEVKKKLKTVKSFGNLNLKKKISFDSGESPELSFSRELKPSAPRLSAEDKGPAKGSFLGRASFASLEKAVDVLDTLGSGMTNLNSSGFLTSKMTKGNKISILAFEVANTITRGASLMQSLSKENVKFIKEEVIFSQGVQHLVSNDINVVLSLAASDKREELDVFCREVIRFGDLCKDAQWHNLDRFFAKLDSDNAVYRQQREQTEAKMQDLMTLAHHTSELYHELNAYDRFDQDYRQKVDEMKSLNIPRKGEHLMMLHSELRQQKRIVTGLKRKSLWSKKLEEIIEKLVDIVAFIHQEIKEVFGAGGLDAGEKPSTSTQSIGAAGLALHYANIVNQIDNIASRPTSLPPNVRNTLYHGLPASVKSALHSSLRKIDPKDELDGPHIKAEMEKILQWLAPMAANTLKAHQGFGWVGEWANASNEFSKNPVGSRNLMRLQTLYHVDKDQMDSHILKLVTLLHRLISAMRTRDYGLKTVVPHHSPSKRISVLNSMTMTKAFPCSYGGSKTLRVELSEEDQRLLERMSKRGVILGISKSQEFTRTTTKSWLWSRSAGSSPCRDLGRTRCPERLKGGDLDLMRTVFEAPF